MGVRDVVFDLLAADVVLAAVRVVHTDQGDSSRAAARGGCQRCSIQLEWAENDQVHAAAGSHLLTVSAHLPRRHATEHLFLDLLLQRVRAVLLTSAANGSITTEYRGMSRDLVASSFDTISKSNRFEVTPRRPCREGTTVLRLEPWAGTDRLATRFGALSGAAQSLN